MLKLARPAKGQIQNGSRNKQAQMSSTLTCALLRLNQSGS